jgi:hypothetical protein
VVTSTSCRCWIPWENGYNGSFNGKLRDELLGREIFCSLREAEVLIGSKHCFDWPAAPNTVRPHSALGYRPPAPETVLPHLMGLPTLRSGTPGRARHGAGQLPHTARRRPMG